MHGLLSGSGFYKVAPRAYITPKDFYMKLKAFYRIKLEAFHHNRQANLKKFNKACCGSSVCKECKPNAHLMMLENSTGVCTISQGYFIASIYLKNIYI
jgi:hypothetical protein